MKTVPQALPVRDLARPGNEVMVEKKRAVARQGADLTPLGDADFVDNKTIVMYP
jgi:hypothetical protein